MSKVKNKYGILIVLISSLCFAVVPTSAKLSLEAGSSLFVVLFSRCLIGLCLLTLSLKMIKMRMIITKNLMLPTLFCSLSSVSLIAITYHAIEFLDIGIVLIIIYSFPIGIALITHIRGEEKLQIFQWSCVFAILIGLILVLIDGNIQTSLYGIGLSFFGLILMIIFIYFSSKLVESIGSQLFNFHINLWSLTFLLFALLIFDLEVSYPTALFGWFALFLNGIFYILCYTLFFIGSQIIGVTRASVLASSEPLLATIIALIALNQYLTLVECFGFLVVIISLYYFEKSKV